MHTKSTAQKLSTKTKLGYGCASIADAVAYNFVLMFFFYFLTDIAGISPALAGLIAFVATIWDACTNPIIGQLSDNSKSKFGRRRFFLLLSCIPLTLAVFLMFTNISLAPAAKNIYYILVAIIFWTAYSMFYIPYTALGAELTLDYDERTKLRMPATIFNYLGNILGMSAPLFIVSLLTDRGFSQSFAWNKVSLMVGLLAFASIVITILSTRGKELMPFTDEAESTQKENGFRIYLNILNMKPYKFLLCICACFIFSYSIFNAIMIYFIQYNLQMTEDTMSTLVLLFILWGIILVPVITLLATKLGKKGALCLCFAISAMAMIIFRFVGIQGFWGMFVFMAVFGIANCAYWQIVPAVIYDMSEVYEYKYGERREGAVTALAIFVVKIGSALAMQCMGIVLQLSGYDASRAVQTTQALEGIETAFMIFPAVLLLLASLIFSKFPITKESFGLLSAAIEKRKTHPEFADEQLNRIM